MYDKLELYRCQVFVKILNDLNAGFLLSLLSWFLLLISLMFTLFLRFPWSCQKLSNSLFRFSVGISVFSLNGANDFKIRTSITPRILSFGNLSINNDKKLFRLKKKLLLWPIMVWFWPLEIGWFVLLCNAIPNIYLYYCNSFLDKTNTKLLLNILITINKE